jgi:hypothetical protein
VPGIEGRSSLVLIARSQIARTTTRKLFVPQRDLVLAWAGYKDVAQALHLSLSESPLDLSQPRSKIAKDARERFRVIRSDPDIEHRSDVNEFLLGWFSKAESNAVALHLMTQGHFEWVERWKFAGSPSGVGAANAAQACVNYISTENLGVEELALVALKVLRDTIAVAPAGALVGDGPQLATISAEGVHILTDTDLRGANDTLDLWEQQSADLLVGSAEVSEEHQQVDRGLGPPG